MPKYDFKCASCALVFEAVRSFAEAADPAACPRDGAPAERLFSPPADILVRGGFRDSLDRRSAAASRPTWSHDDLSCHTHEPAPADRSNGDGHDAGHAHDNAVGDGDGNGNGQSHGHEHGHSHVHSRSHTH